MSATLKSFELAYDVTLQGVVRVKIDAETLEQAETAARAEMENMQDMQIMFDKDIGNATLTEASVVCEVPYHDDSGPVLFEINGLDADDYDGLLCDDCGNELDLDGYDGKCSTCADKAENAKQSEGHETKIVIVLEGGLVKCVLADGPGVDVAIIDYDTDGADEVVQIQQPDGDEAPARVYLEAPEIDQERVAELWAAVTGEGSAA